MIYDDRHLENLKTVEVLKEYCKSLFCDRPARDHL